MASTYPPPPDHYKLCLDSQLQPPPPIHGSYTVFGETANSAVSLPQLPSRSMLQTDGDGSIDIVRNLRRLNRQLVLSVQELMDALVKTPSECAREQEDVLAVQSNMMHLCNMLRPVQARASLKQLLQQKVDEKQALLERLQNDSAAAQRTIASTLHG